MNNYCVLGASGLFFLFTSYHSPPPYWSFSMWGNWGRYVDANSTLYKPHKNHMTSEEQNQDSNSCLQSPKLILCLLLWVMSKYFAKLWKICQNNHNKIFRANGGVMFCGGVMCDWRIMSLCDLEFHHSTLLANIMTVSDSPGCPDHHVSSLCGENVILREFKWREESSSKAYDRKHRGFIYGEILYHF